VLASLQITALFESPIKRPRVFEEKHITTRFLLWQNSDQISSQTLNIIFLKIPILYFLKS